MHSVLLLGTKESEDAIAQLVPEGYDVDLIELTCMKAGLGRHRSSRPTSPSLTLVS